MTAGKITLMSPWILKHPHWLIGKCFQAKLETKALKAKRPGFTDDRYSETSYYVENGELLVTYCRLFVAVLL
jgi:hypothetical protein